MRKKVFVARQSLLCFVFAWFSTTSLLLAQFRGGPGSGFASIALKLREPTGLHPETDSVVVFPVPAQKWSQLAVNKPFESLKIYNSQGIFLGAYTSFDQPQWSSGFYLLVVCLDKKRHIPFKIMIL